AFPQEYYGDAFVGECAFNLVHHKKLYRDDAGLKARRPPDEQNVEFLASTDNWFRPVQFANAPDGTLYVIDMYREVIEHPWSLPESIKKFLDLDSGSNRGRIYRIVPDGFKQPDQPRLQRATTEQLVNLLEHPNGWHRDTAARLIYERQDPAAVPLLLKLHENSKSPLGRLRALYSLAGLGALKEAQVLESLNGPEPHLREHAIKLSERFIEDGRLSHPLWDRLQSMADDSDIRVRYQLAFTLGEVKDPNRILALEKIIRRDSGSRWVTAAVLSSLADGAADLFSRLCPDPEFRQATGARDFLLELVRITGAKNQPAEINRVVELTDQVRDPELLLSLTRALGDGLRRAGSSLLTALGKDRAQRVFAQSAGFARDSQAGETTRIEAIRLLDAAPYAEAGPVLLQLITSTQQRSLEMAALSTLAHFTDPEVGRELVQRWTELDAQMRSAVVSTLLARPERASFLLDAIQAGTIPRSELTTSQLKFLRNHGNSEVRLHAEQVLGPVGADARQKVVEAFRPALQLTGDAVKGKQIYLERCSSCHRLEGQGFALGPDLVTVKQSGKEKLLGNILDPNREVAPQYIAFDIETKDDESYVGIIGNETTSTLTVMQAFGKKDVIQRTHLRSMRSLGQSLMPEGLETGLTAQDLANLLEFISTAHGNR
ncbi:MAG: DUF7133 domain-containing protein, partial [Limisphaerales bacterium]